MAIIAASLGPEQFEHAYQHRLNHWKANEAYNPQVEANMIDLMGDAAERVSTRRKLMLASTFLLGWVRGEWPARASYAGVVTSTVQARSGDTPTAPILDRLTAVGAARLVLANGHR